MPTTDFYSGGGDGNVLNANASYSTCHDAVTGSGFDYTSTVLTIRTSAPSTNYTVSRIFLPIDTSGLSDTCTVTAATLNITCTQPLLSYGTCDMALVQTSQSSTSTLSTADFDQCGSISNPTEGATRIEVFSTGVKTMTLDSTGISWISKSGFTMLGLRTGWLDCDNATPTLSSQEMYTRFASSETTGTSSDPYLSVTWSEPSTFTPKVIII